MLSVIVQKKDANLDDLLAWVQEGTEVIIMEGETTVARVTPSEFVLPPLRERVLGAFPGAWMSDDFDTPFTDEFWLGRDA